MASLIMASWQKASSQMPQNGKLMNWQFEVRASWQNGNLTKWQFDKMASWQNDFAPKNLVQFLSASTGRFSAEVISLKKLAPRQSGRKINPEWKFPSLSSPNWRDSIILESFISCCWSLVQSNHLHPFPGIEWIKIN